THGQIEFLPWDNGFIGCDHVDNEPRREAQRFLKIRFLLPQEELHLFVLGSALNPLKLLQRGGKIGSNIGRPDQVYFLPNRNDSLLQIGSIGCNRVVELREIMQPVYDSGEKLRVLGNVDCLLDKLDASGSWSALLKTALSLRSMHASA